MTATETFRTAALGGHVERCDPCAHERIAYNSCANRHCSKCQSLARAAWLERRTAELLDTEYFHVVFTVPALIADLAFRNEREVYRLLFRATADTLRTIAADPDHLGAEIGFFAVLQTWGQTLTHNPNLHCVTPGGGLSLDGTRWVACRPASSYRFGCSRGSFAAASSTRSRRPTRRAPCDSRAPSRRCARRTRGRPRWPTFARPSGRP